MKRLVLTLATIAFALILVTCGKFDNGVITDTIEGNSKDTKGNQLQGGSATITSLSPSSAEIGDELTINGTNFSTSRGVNDFVTIMGIKATIHISWSKTQIKVLVPSGSAIGSGKVSVTIRNKKSNEVNFTLLESSDITIGTQIWMGHNLNESKYSDNTDIPECKDPTEWDNLTTGAWCYYNNNPAMGAIYGKLYNWYAVEKGIKLPAGYRIPTDAEFKTLFMYLGMTETQANQYGYNWDPGTDEGGKLKEQGTSLWYSPNVGATNQYGFTALPSGMRSMMSGYDFIDASGAGYFWTSTVSEYNSNGVWMRGLGRHTAKTYRNYLGKGHGFSVRLIKG